MSWTLHPLVLSLDFPRKHQTKGSTHKHQGHALLISLVLLSGCCPANSNLLTLPRPADLPARVYFRTPTQTFNKNYYLVLRGGRIWYKDNIETTGKKTAWRPLGRTGLPEGSDIVRFPPPKQITSISADGIHLMAVSNKGIFYRGTNLRNNIRCNFSWSDKWGWPMAGGPGLKMLPHPARAWSASDAHPFDLKYYEDGNGTRHHIGFGVAHLYLLGHLGKEIHYNDWWLPADWSRQICGPNRGQFEAINLSASGSTLFLIGRDGTMFTKMADFDISGENPLLTYSFVLKKARGTIRKLPMPEWKKQPKITKGRITSTITIFQNGIGNKARVLRVEGQQEHTTGYFEKSLDAPSWKFHPTNMPLTARFLATRSTRQPPVQAAPGLSSAGTQMFGFLKKHNLVDTFKVRLHNFSMFCSPARLSLYYKGKPLRVKGVALSLLFHHVHTLVTHRRKIRYWEHGEAAQIRGAIVLDPKLQEVDDPQARPFIKQFFGKDKVINLTGTTDLKTLKMRELSFWDWFQAPAHEKGFRSRITLTLQTTRPAALHQ